MRSDATPMVDAVKRVTGTIPYASDISLPGMLHGRLLRSPYPHARVVRVDASAAAALPDVVVLTPEDLRADPSIVPYFGPQLKDQPALAMDRVRFVGDPVAAVAAPDDATARRVVDLIEVEYEELPAVFDPVEAMAPGAPLLHDLAALAPGVIHFGLRPIPGTNCCHRFRLLRGDAEAALRDADVVVEGTFRTPVASQCPMEAHSSTAVWEGDRLIVWTATQTPYNVRDDLAQMFRMPSERVRVVVPTLGGAYGSKAFPKLEPIAALLARKAGRPVKVTLDHHEVYLMSTRHASVIALRMGARRDGTLVAVAGEAYWGTGAYAESGPAVGQKGGYHCVGPYRVPNVHIESYTVYTNLPPAGAFRGFSSIQAAWASESLVDELARALDMDPLELRRKNLLRDGDVFATGETMHDVHFEELLDTVARNVGWGAPLAQPAAPHLVRGRGLGVMMKGSQTPSRATASVRVDAEGRVTALTSAVEMGQGVRTVFAKIVAAELGLPYETVEVATPDTDVTPFDTRTTSSRSTYLTGTALRNAALDLKARLRQEVAARCGVGPEAVVIAGGRARVGDRAYTLGEAVRLAGLEHVQGDGAFAVEGTLDPETGQGIASAHWHQGAAAVEVEVDVETGKVRVVDCQAAVYAGTVVNRLGAELQNEGSVIWAIGSAFLEETAFDQGQILNATLAEYMVPSFLDVPTNLHVETIERPGAEPYGLGESALPPTICAIGNAVAAALGARVFELPLTPERVLRAARRASGEPPAE
ncbi:MAG TPA: xanthine dehydrogenase family protein molybdopterin-binding subunit [Chloroflexota bacterium]